MPDGSTLAEPQDPFAVAFDDRAWRTLDLPHDWGVEGPFRDDLDSGSGKLPWQAIGWYRKQFIISPTDKGSRLFVEFDGAMANAEVWLNGQKIGGWPYGYMSFSLDLTPHVQWGGTNVLAVRLDTTKWGSRWYPGAGIYRTVWLTKTAPVHVAHWGVQITTPRITDERGDVSLAVTIDNQSASTAPVAVAATIHPLPRAAPRAGRRQVRHPRRQRLPPTAPPRLSFPFPCQSRNGGM